ncbi:uncharacterized protein Z518_07805 [Rhinocladiella mackenziei CBS 650.93]|uniref:Xylanolytic transcriptional activator regulatory domain-containing protein n=1 Tax=Rhinocladiella mackenziei CBS 650.93 TaxID=1442369 RepID=A0A0D2IM56_9EURO|nr:uncharacterized protein Z518_07805 [Rhinocladiella mackenziei CBS 650.93]KIX04251.1 hypothetical protein Z518_07805 [Rhinocladiella mackenziei CBS 650.93]
MSKTKIEVRSRATMFAVRRKIHRLRSRDDRAHVPQQEEDARPPLLHPDSESPQSRFSNGEGHEAKSIYGEPSTAPHRQQTAVSLDQISTTDPHSYNQRISSVGLTQEIIDNFSPETVLESSTSALPGGIGRSQPSLGNTKDEITVEDLLGFELPSKRVTDYLLSTYLGAVHWFMMVFHEPTLRTSYEALMATRRCARARSNHIIFMVLLLSLGAHYAPEEEVHRKFPSFQLETFQRLSLKRVEDSLHTLYDAAELESVQVCVLLGSYYMYHGRPNLAFVVLGAGLRCAQLMSLHKESAWRWQSEMAKEERRRTFWALFVFDRFAATIFGRPCGIPNGEIDVKIPENIGDTTTQHPNFRSTAAMPDGTIEPVTTFSYMKYKFKLYQISSPIIGDLYFHRSPSVSALAAKVSRINDELVNWFNVLPPELKLEELCRNPVEPATPSTRPFMLQALALQIAYDNVQILLHRPLLSQDLRSFKVGSRPLEPDEIKYPSELNNPRHESQTAYPDVHQILLSSRDKCWDSAIRSSKLGKYHQCLVSARESHAAAFLGINLFTAGMVLCVVALSRPLSAQAQMAKQAIARIMSLSRFLSGKVLLSAQTTKILKDLVRLIGEKEIKAMLSGSDVPESRTMPSGHISKQQTEMIPSLAAIPGPGREFQADADNMATSQNSIRTGDESILSGLYQDPSFTDSFDFSGLENMDFNNGIVTLQQAMFPASAVATPDVNRLMNDGTQRGPWNRDQYNTEHSYINQTGGSDDGLMRTDFNMMTTVGQTWLWDSENR